MKLITQIKTIKDILICINLISVIYLTQDPAK